MPADWTDELLSRHPGASAPPDFAQRLRTRIQSEDLKDVAGAGRAVPVLRPVFRQLVPMAAAAIVFLAVGFWLGRETDHVGDPTKSAVEESAVGEIPSSLEELQLLQAWDLVADESLELGWAGSGLTVEQEEQK